MGGPQSVLGRGWQAGVLVVLLLFVAGLRLAVTGHDNWAMVLLGAATGSAVSTIVPLFSRLSRRDEPHG